MVELLAAEWSQIASLLAELDDSEWSAPALPGWDVHDVVAHLVGGERMLDGEPTPSVPDEPDSAPHVGNDIARMNEAWVVELRKRSHAELRSDFVAITDKRLATLRAMSDEDFAAPSWTPVGHATYGRFMAVRVFDAWMHEQDIRAATARPGHEDGPVAEAALDEVVGALGYIVGKRGGAPDGSLVTFRLTEPLRRELHVVVTGKAHVVDALPGEPTVTMSLSSSLFLRLAGGRLDPATALDRVEISGDPSLGRQLVTNLGYTI